MTDSVEDSGAGKGGQQRGKRERLVSAARELFHQRGVETTSISDVAQAADVPVGNVYYYFKTKDDLVEGVIDDHLRDVISITESFERLRTPRARLKALARALIDQREIAARYGCPHGTLCSELDKRPGGPAGHAARLLKASIDWAEEQFRQMGRLDARELAVALIASYQGISLLANTFRDPDLMTREARRLERWIDSLA
jgi:AcrR family transcriptional regulator